MPDEQAYETIVASLIKHHNTATRQLRMRPSRERVCMRESLQMEITIVTNVNG